MAQERTRKPATRGRRKAKDTTGAAEEPGADAGGANGILLLRSFGEDGSVTVQVQRLGDCQVTELETVLRMGLRQVSESLSGGG